MWVLLREFPNQNQGFLSSIQEERKSNLLEVTLLLLLFSLRRQVYQDSLIHEPYRS